MPSDRSGGKKYCESWPPYVNTWNEFDVSYEHKALTEKNIQSEKPDLSKTIQRIHRKHRQIY